MSGSLVNEWMDFGSFSSNQRRMNAMSIIKEFKEFAIKGNAIDMAVGIIIGAAFGGIVNSVVKDLIMPPIGIIGNADFTNMYVPLSRTGYDAWKAAETMSLADAQKNGPVLAYGSFLTVLVNFLIIAFCVFLLVKAINALKRKEAVAPSAPPPTPEDVLLLREIRDELKRH